MSFEAQASLPKTYGRSEVKALPLASLNPAGSAEMVERAMRAQGSKGSGATRRGSWGRWHGGGVVELGVRGSLTGPRSGPMTILLATKPRSRRASGGGENTLKKNDGRTWGCHAVRDGWAEEGSGGGGGRLTQQPSRGLAGGIGEGVKRLLGLAHRGGSMA